MSKKKQQQQANNNTNNSGSNSGQVCSVHGKAHEHDVQCRKNPVWTNMYQYRQVCACGDVMSDWHS